jgi:hypothetical protein
MELPEPTIPIVDGPMSGTRTYLSDARIRCWLFNSPVSLKPQTGKIPRPDDEVITYDRHHFALWLPGYRFEVPIYACKPPERGDVLRMLQETRN